MITVYAKKKKTNDGKTFLIYLTTIKVKGEGRVVRVRFKENTPKTFPVNIEVTRNTANLSHEKYDRDGVTQIATTLWIKDWLPADVDYRDQSMDDVEL